MSARVLVACEFSGVIRDAFIDRGHDAVSCDLLPSETPGPHIQGDVRAILNEPWDLVIAHPPCDKLSNLFWCQSTRFVNRTQTCRAMLEGIRLFWDCLHANSPLIAVENPRQHPIARSVFGRADTYVEPYEHGHPYSKRTFLWLKGLPPIMPTHVVGKRGQKHIAPWVVQAKADRVKFDSVTEEQSSYPKTPGVRAKTFPGIAAAMADQWGALL